MTQSSRPGLRGSWLWLPVLIAPLLFLHYAPLERTTTVGLELRNLGHIPLFAIVTLALLRLFSGLERPWRERYAWAIGVAILLGGVSELLQIPMQRDADLGDLGRDLIGISLAALLHRRFWEREYTGVVRGGLMVFVMLAVMTVTGWPLYRALAAERSRAQAFPVLFDFEEDWQDYYLDPAGVGIVRHESPPAWQRPNPSTAARLHFDNKRYPRITFDELQSDWTGYDALSFDLYSEQSHAVKLMLRIDDKLHDHRWADRYNRRLHIVPGHNAIRIPLVEIREGPEHRDLDFHAIASMTLYFSRPRETRILWIDDIQLTLNEN